VSFRVVEGKGEPRWRLRKKGNSVSKVLKKERQGQRRGGKGNSWSLGGSKGQDGWKEKKKKGGDVVKKKRKRKGDWEEFSKIGKRLGWFCPSRPCETKETKVGDAGGGRSLSRSKEGLQKVGRATPSAPSH